eukprot:scaffold367_cov202-Alexandrium_tamarense.AAC.32
MSYVIVSSDTAFAHQTSRPTPKRATVHCAHFSSNSSLHHPTRRKTFTIHPYMSSRWRWI